jgi:hypothetical protein
MLIWYSLNPGYFPSSGTFYSIQNFKQLDTTKPLNGSARSFTASTGVFDNGESNSSSWAEGEIDSEHKPTTKHSNIASI